MPYLPRVPAFPIAAEKSILTAAGAALKIPAKEKPSPLIGRAAPEIYAKDHLGRDVSLHATLQLGRPIVLYFFPLAGSPHCTKESCSFRDAVGTSPIFNDLNAVVIGISQDPPARSRRFVDEHHLGFRILHDSERQIMDAWGVGRGLLGLIDGRCTFVIDHEGIVRGMLDGVWDCKGHRDFAEKWLCRIEHELSGRERFYVKHDADDAVACDEISRNVKVIYGDTLPVRAVATAPRHGAAPSATKLKAKALSDPTRSESLSLAAEAHVEALARPKPSRRNLKNWLRPSESASNVYDEPLHVDYRHINGVWSADKVAARVQAMRVDEASSSSDHAAVIARDFADAAPLTRNGSGSGSGWATPSTISARSVSTGETSHASPGPESHALKLAAAIHSGISAGNATELERSGSSRRAAGSSNGHAASGIVAAQGVLPKARSSSLITKRASADSAAAPAEAAVDAGAGATVYANGNIARMSLLPSVNGEASADTMLTVQDRRSRMSHRTGDGSADSTYSSNGAGSLPVPPRPATRSGGAGGAVAAAAAARLRRHAPDGAEEEAEEAYDTDRGVFKAGRDAIATSSVTPSPSPASVAGTPPARAHPFSSTASSPHASGAVAPAPADAAPMDRRLSNTPSLANSMASYDASAHSEYEYSPSLAESTHTFGGLD
ncbi:related to peroxiredoxin q [Sporisorium reilianum SRZ2]|uniref:thioredoxin-dependent peroxiredoxin n=1 Tax=Sporisorium reilianum (strain SRZ2) TaxID=999809 RepID=E7A2A0_SPORE|nr:related to peroxiredoxin q [Sporisorium reilianum SRZ2]